MSTPQLLPLPGNPDLCLLHAENGMLVARKPGEPDEALPIGQNGAVALASYTSTIRIDTGRTLRRSGWLVLDESGTCLWWLAHSDQQSYDRAAASRFADQAGMALVGLGELEPAELSSIRGKRIGTSTSPVSPLVAPPLHWALTLVCGTGIATFGALGILVGLPPVGAVLLGFMGLFLGIFVARRTAMYLYGWHSNRFYNRQGLTVLRTRARIPGAVIVADRGRVSCYDAFTRHGYGDAIVKFYGAPGEKKHGLLVAWPGASYVDYRCPFDEAEVVAFTQANGVPLDHIPETGVATNTPQARRGNLSWARHMGPLLPLAPVVMVALGGGLVVGTLTLLDVLPLETALGAFLVALPANVLSGLWLGRLQFSAALTRPAAVMTRTTVQG